MLVETSVRSVVRLLFPTYHALFPGRMLAFLRCSCWLPESRSRGRPDGVIFRIKYHLFRALRSRDEALTWELLSGVLPEDPCVWRPSPPLLSSFPALFVGDKLRLGGSPPGPLSALGGGARLSSPSPFPRHSLGPESQLPPLGRCWSCSVIRPACWPGWQQPSWPSPSSSVYPPPRAPCFPLSRACPAAHCPSPSKAQPGRGLSFRAPTQVGLRLAPSSYEAASSGEGRTDRLRVPMPPRTRPAGLAPGKVLACWLRSRASETGGNGPR